MRIRLIIVNILLLKLLTCCAEKQKEIYIHEIDTSIVNEAVAMSDYFDLVKTICLDKEDRPVLGYIDKVKEFKNNIYILDRYSSKQILVFDINGKFIRKIGFQGDGPGGYNESYDFYINEDENTIEILTIGKIMIYSIDDGEYIRSKELTLPATRFSKMDKYYAFVLGSRNSQLCITDNNFKILKTYFDYSIMHSMLPQNSFFKNNSSELFFYRNFENIIYKIDGTEISKYNEYYFDGKKKSISEEKKLKITSPAQVFEEFSNYKLMNLFHFETFQHSIFSYIYKNDPFLVIRNKDRMQHQIFDVRKIKNDLIDDNGSYGSFPIPIGVNDRGNILCVVNLESDNVKECSDSLDFVILELKIKF